MIKFVYKLTRPSKDVKWFARPLELQQLTEEERKNGRLLHEEFKLDDDGLTLYTSTVWSNLDDYSNYITSPQMLEWRSDRAIYNSKNKITFELFSKIEDWEPNDSQ